MLSCHIRIKVRLSSLSSELLKKITQLQEEQLLTNAFKKQLQDDYRRTAEENAAQIRALAQRDEELKQLRSKTREYISKKKQDDARKNGQLMVLKARAPEA